MTNILEFDDFCRHALELVNDRTTTFLSLFRIMFKTVKFSKSFNSQESFFLFSRIFFLFYEPFPKLPITPLCVSVGAWSGKITLNFSQKSSFEIFLISSNGNASSLLYLV